MACMGRQDKTRRLLWLREYEVFFAVSERVSCEFVWCVCVCMYVCYVYAVLCKGVVVTKPNDKQ